MSGRNVTRALGALLVFTLVLTGCRKQAEEGGDQQTGSMTGEEVKAARSDWPEGVSAQVDAGNEAYKAKDLDKALEHYEAALKAAGDSKSAKITSYFGIYMVQVARGDSVAAAQAMAKAQEIAPEASLIHGGPAGMPPAGMPAMPPGHPSTPAPQTPNDSIHRKQ